MRDTGFIETELNRCNKCGYCMQSCPVYREERREVAAARGRLQVLRAVIEGDTDLSRETLQPFFDCLLCGACTVDCFGSVLIKDLMVRAREAYQAEYGQPAIQRYIFRKLLPDPKRLTRIVRLAALGKRSGLFSVARSLGLLRWLSPTLDLAEGLMATMPRTFLRDRLPRLGFTTPKNMAAELFRLEPEQATGPKVLYFIGCATNFQLPQVAEAAIALLARAGCQVTIVPNYCCGLPAWSYGDINAAQRLAELNLELLASLEFDFVVIECGSCSGFLKKYAELLPEDPRATALVECTRDFTELLVELSLPRPAPDGTTVTYHDPCYLGREQGVTEQPRKLLVDVGGFELVEMAEANWCCGGAGSYNLSNPQMSQQVLGRKLDRIADTGAEVVATACPACIIQIEYGARTRGWQRPVRHVAELLAERHGIGVD